MSEIVFRGTEIECREWAKLKGITFGDDFGFYLMLIGKKWVVSQDWNHGREYNHD